MSYYEFVIKQGHSSIRRQHMRKLATTVFLLAVLAGTAAAGAITPALQDRLNSSAGNELIRILITMEEQADYHWMMQQTEGLDKRATRAWVVDYLQTMAAVTQQDVRDYLEAMQAQGKVQHLQSVFIVNLLHGLATPEVIRALDNFPGVAEVEYDPERYMLAVEPARGPVHATDGSDEIAWGVSNVNAPQVWQQGYTGTGVIVGVCDTGVNYNHVDLADHLWNGGAQYPNHGYDFYSNDNNPMDDGPSGHGTHVAGSVASDGTAGSQCGVAPNATIMCVKVLSSGGSGTEGPVISGINFCVQQGADIFSMSLGWQTTSQKIQFRTACNNALAAGVIGSIAAGNEGNLQGFYPLPGNVRTPGDVPPPWLHPNQTLTGGLSCVVTVGAYDINNNAAAFSSHGPVTWQGVGTWNDYPYNPGMGLIDPDISAPGVSVKSLAYNSNTGYLNGSTWSGTSMATPHVAGAMALMLQKNPALTPAQIDQYLEQSAVEAGTAGKDNTYGAGRLNALAAVNLVPGGTPPNVDLTLAPIGAPIQIPASGGSFSYNATLANLGASGAVVDAWIMQQTPSGSWQGPMLGPLSLVLPSGANITRQRTQNVPGTAAPGTYTYRGYLGAYIAGTKYDSSSFTYSKLSTGDGALVTNWENYGESFDLTEPAAAPQAHRLVGASPNPFNPTTALGYQLSAPGRVSLRVYDASGRQVTALVDGWKDAGSHEVTFDGSGLSSGIYFARLTAAGTTEVQKLVLLK
ncbi:MAG: T9SS C-terminal target domain-containing protein [Candidatus Zixiibacteriota bacterium]|nr:MAG: T9SS C-terminal target domain-containing protein [candidate division Zixibacteria bacterium]